MVWQSFGTTTLNIAKWMHFILVSPDSFWYTLQALSHNCDGMCAVCQANGRFMKNVLFEQYKIQVWYKWSFVENKRIIVQHILKMQ
jgi:hypothetical protein